MGSIASMGSFQEMGLMGWFLVDLAINVGGWAVAAVKKTEKFYDLLGSVSFLTLTGGSLLLPGPITARKVLVSGMVGIWAVRLGSYLVSRVHKVGSDSRFDGVKEQPLTFLFYWVMQAAWVFVTLSPVLIVNGAKATTPLGLLDLLGVAIYSAGLGFEVVADRQKDAFRSKPENKGQFITEGLWSISRHPNYFGESLLWWGVFFTAARSFTSTAQLASVASPLFVFLLVRYVSGTPILERQADQRWGHLPEYQAYKESTSIFFPMPKFGGAKAEGYSSVPAEEEEREQEQQEKDEQGKEKEKEESVAPSKQ